MQDTSSILFILAPILNPITYSIVIELLVIIIVWRVMRTKRFYFVRHGETLLNAKRIRQGPEGALSEKGRAQAEQVGKYLEHLAIEKIISSPYERAQETSQIINEHFHVPVVLTPLLAERRNPTNIIGKSTHDPEVERIVDQMDLAYHEDDFRISDEENFVDEKIRGRDFLKYLAREGKRETVVVTHHHFLKMVVAYILYRENLHAGDFIKLSFLNVSDNAGITICEFNPWHMFGATKGWSVVSFNEQPEAVAV